MLVVPTPVIFRISLMCPWPAVLQCMLCFAIAVKFIPQRHFGVQCNARCNLLRFTTSTLCFRIRALYVTQSLNISFYPNGLCKSHLTFNEFYRLITKSSFLQIETNGQERSDFTFEREVSTVLYCIQYPLRHGTVVSFLALAKNQVRLTVYRVESVPSHFSERIFKISLKVLARSTSRVSLTSFILVSS